VEFFENKCNLPIGASERLANLARELAGGETAGIKSKLLSFMSCTPRRQQANNVTGNRQRTELSYAAPSRQAKLILNEEIYSRIYLRTNTVKRLAEILDHEWVVHMGGTLSTGKTTLAYLLREYCKERGDSVVYVNRWTRQPNVPLESYLASNC